MGKIGQNPKIGQLWRPVAPQTYVVEKRWPTSETWTTTRSKQYLSAVHPVSAVSEVPVWLDFDVRFWGQMTPKVIFFCNWHSGFCDSTPNYVSWPNLVKIGRWEVPERSRGLPNKKTRAPRDSSQPPFWPKWADRAQNSLNVVTPWPVHVHRIWTGSAAFCRTYSGKKINFSAQKLNTII